MMFDRMTSYEPVSIWDTADGDDDDKVVVVVVVVVSGIEDHSTDTLSTRQSADST
jgi:hypothetical protein